MARPRKRCENCTQWSSTDQVWGSCTYASSRDRDGTKIALAEYVDLGEEHQADLNTRYDFGCVLWASLAKAIKRISNPLPASGNGG